MAAVGGDLPRGGRQAQIDAADLLGRTTQTTPAATYWSTRTLAAEMAISYTTMQQVWKANGIKARLAKSFKVSRDPAMKISSV